MASTTTSEIRYSQILRSYKKHLSQHGDIPLSRYSKEHHVYYQGMKGWINAHQISIIDIRKSLVNSRNKEHQLNTSVLRAKNTAKSSAKPSPKTSSSILPLHMTDTNRDEIAPILTSTQTRTHLIPKLKITYPTGIIVEVEDVSHPTLEYLLSLTQ